MPETAERIPISGAIGELLAEVRNGDLPALYLCDEAEAEILAARREGAERMRERCAKEAKANAGLMNGGIQKATAEYIAASIRALPLEGCSTVEEKPHG